MRTPAAIVLALVVLALQLACTDTTCNENRSSLPLMRFYNVDAVTRKATSATINVWVEKMVKEDYALVRSIATDEDDGEQTVSVWFIMISTEPQGFSGSIDCGIEHANEALDTLVALLATLSPK